MASAIPRITLLLFLAFYGFVYAQPRLEIDSVSTLPTDTVEYNGNAYIVQYITFIENIGNAKLDGPVTIQMRFNGDSTIYDMAEVTVSNFEVGMRQQIDFTDTIYTITGAQARYKGGDNILVIWPHADNPNMQIPDTADHDLYVKDLTPNATDEHTALLDRRIDIYPNPAHHTLHFRYHEDRHKLEYVRISTLEGKPLRFTQSAVADMDISTLPAGVYMVDVRYRDGVQGTFRLIHLD